MIQILFYQSPLRGVLTIGDDIAAPIALTTEALKRSSVWGLPLVTSSPCAFGFELKGFSDLSGTDVRMEYPNIVYKLLFACASSTLKNFGLNPKHLGADIGMTAVPHTHNQRLDYHPHVHVVVPGGGVDKAKKQWKKKKSKFLFNPIYY
jgi:Putative transposase